MSCWRACALAVLLAACSTIDSTSDDMKTVDLSRSTFVVNHDSAVVGDEVIVGVTLRDPEGHPVSGVQVTLIASGEGNAFTPLAPTDETGYAYATWRATRAELKSIQAFIGNDSLGQRMVDWVHGRAVRVQFRELPSDTDAGGLIAADVELEDVYGNLVPQAAPAISVELLVNPTATTLYGGSSRMPRDGVASFNLRIDTPATGYVLRATAPDLLAGDSEPFDVLTGQVDPAQSSLSVAPRAVAVGGSTAVSIVVHVANTHGIPIAGQSVMLAASGTNNVITPPLGITDAFGDLTARWTSSSVGQQQLTAMVGVAMLSTTATFYGQPCSLRLPGPPQAAAYPGAHSLAVADYDADGHLDLFDGNGGVIVRHSEGDGTYKTWPYGYGVDTDRWSAVADLDGDGLLDLVAATQFASTVQLLLGIDSLSYGSFLAQPVDAETSSLAIADFTGDGVLDLAAAHPSLQRVSIYPGVGDGSFGPAVATLTTGPGPTWLVSADLDNNGSPDLVVENAGDLTTSAFLATGNATFGPEVVTAAYGKLVLKDVNADGILDALLADPQSSMLHVRLGNGAGGFAAGQSLDTGVTDGAIAVADFNGDMHVDTAIANRPRFAFLAGSGNGTFTLGNQYVTNAPSARGIGAGAAVDDADADGKPDVLVAIGAIRNLGNGQFALPRVAAPEHLLFDQTADFNEDGRPDLLAHHGATSAVAVLLGTSSGALTRVASTVTVSQTAKAIFGDLNEDGHQDAVIFDGAMTILFGDGTGAFTAGTPPSVPPAYDGVLTDVNGDGHLDLIALTNSGMRVAIGTGQGTFSVSTMPYASVAQAIAADVDGDGAPDLITPYGFMIGVNKNKGNSTYDVYPSTIGIVGDCGAPVNSIAAADFDGDGHVDVAASCGGPIKIWLGRADGTFVARAETYYVALTGTMFRMQVADIDNSATPDLVIDTPSGVIVLQNIGDATFKQPVSFGYGGTSGLTNNSLLVVTDLNADGKLDIAFSTSDGVAVAFQAACLP